MNEYLRNVKKIRVNQILYTVQYGNISLILRIFSLNSTVPFIKICNTEKILKQHIRTLINKLSTEKMKIKNWKCQN